MKKLMICMSLLMLATTLFGHCQVPCGIYNDSLRYTLLAEDIATIEKSMKAIHKLQKEQPLNYNQLVRWIQNKDRHAEKIQHLVWYYFLAQRVKPVDEKAPGHKKYLKKIRLLHLLIFYAMKAKQSVDLKYVALLRKYLNELKAE